MAKESDEKRLRSSPTSWGPRLFVGVFVGVLLFFYWLLIYSGGVSGHNG